MAFRDKLEGGTVNRRNRGIHLLFGSLSQLRSAATSSPESTAMKGRVCSLLGSPPGQAPWDLIKVQQDSNSRTERLMQAPNSPSVFLGPSSPAVPVTLTRRTGWLCGDGGLAGGSPTADTVERARALLTLRSCCLWGTQGQGPRKGSSPGFGAAPVGAGSFRIGPGRALVRTRMGGARDDS